MKFSPAPACLGLVLFISSCAVGPNHQTPDVSDLTPARWKWQEAAPRDATPRGNWWTIFGDAELNRIEAQAVAGSQELRSAMARLDQARAAIGLSTAAFMPQFEIQGGAQRERTSGNPPSPVPITIPSSQINSFNAALQLSYEIDLWGRVRRNLESARAQVDARGADYHGVLLSLTADVASNYFLVRGFDTQSQAIRRTIAGHEQGLALMQQRFQAGTIPAADLARARSELATSRADLAEVKRQREETVNILALLSGRPASQFSVSERALSGAAPRIPAGLPATLLERRPDVASAERLVAARSADIGVEIAGYFPAVSLTGQGGYLSKDTASLFSADSRVWSIGPGVTVPVTGFFVTKARVNRARALHDEAVAGFRQAVLRAVKDVETALVQIRYRREQLVAQEEAAAAAAEALALTRQLYEGGSLSYLELLDAGRTSLLRERQVGQVRAQGHMAAVSLIRALGGEW